ncbi:MAG TPA: 2-hydroxyacyl-CoA dehydratase [Geobacterales bacterium]|nr:2-hydroxyacyl-CoA dehydratase [Geobacterales bacterium]
MDRVGFTSTIPLEVLVAAGRRPVDLNNIFIGHAESQRLVDRAEMDGFPRTICAWIKGIYGAVLEQGIREVVAVTEGDCSTTRALMEVLSLKGVRIVPFAYPHDRDPAAIRLELDKMLRHYGVTWSAAEAAKVRLDRIRSKLVEVDRLTWEENRVCGKENHLWLVSASDMNGDPHRFEAELDLFLAEARTRPPRQEPLRLAYLGVPPMMPDLYPFLEQHGARVVFNETQRQFAMPYGASDLVEQYLAYTYPYDIFFRLADILVELKRRHVQGVIHYVQSFCFRQVEDLIVRQKLPLPILTLEGDRPGPLDARTKIRIEGFLEMVGAP